LQIRYTDPETGKEVRIATKTHDMDTVMPRRED
jgi:hypothetical protein